MSTYVRSSMYFLPQDVLHGECNTYTTLCKTFMKYVLDIPENEMVERFDQTDMIQVNILDHLNKARIFF